MRRPARLLAALLLLLPALPPAEAVHEGLPAEDGMMLRTSPGWIAFKVTSNATPTQPATVWLGLDTFGGTDLRGAGIAVLDGQGELRMGGFTWTYREVWNGRRVEALNVPLWDTRPHLALSGEDVALGLTCTGCLVGATHVVLYTHGTFDRMRVSFHADALQAVSNATGDATFAGVTTDAEWGEERMSGVTTLSTLVVKGRPVGFFSHNQRAFVHQSYAGPAGARVCPCWIGGADEGPGLYQFVETTAEFNARGSTFLAGADVTLPP